MLKHVTKFVPWAMMAGLLALVAAAPAGAEVLGQPYDGQLGLQAAATPIAHEIHDFYNLVNTIIIAIAVFVLLLMVYVMFRFNAKANPTPSTTTHHTLLEVAWTVVPVLILIVIAIPSFKLLMNQYTYPKADLTIKAIGNAWFWSISIPTTQLPRDEQHAFRRRSEGALCEGYSDAASARRRQRSRRAGG